jgi:hypothetical protein
VKSVKCLGTILVVSTNLPLVVVMLKAVTVELEEYRILNNESRAIVEQSFFFEIFLNPNF